MNSLKSLSTLCRNDQLSIFFISMGGVLFFVGYIFIEYHQIMELNPDLGEIINELLAVLFILAPLIFPAVLGLLYFVKEGVNIDQSVKVCFWLYLFDLLFAIFIFFQPDFDPIGNCLSLINIALPVGFTLSIILVTKMVEEENGIGV